MMSTSPIVSSSPMSDSSSPSLAPGCGETARKVEMMTINLIPRDPPFSGVAIVAKPQASTLEITGQPVKEASETFTLRRVYRDYCTRVNLGDKQDVMNDLWSQFKHQFFESVRSQTCPTWIKNASLESLNITVNWMAGNVLIENREDPLENADFLLITSDNNHAAKIYHEMWKILQDNHKVADYIPCAEHAEGLIGSSPALGTSIFSNTDLKKPKRSEIVPEDAGKQDQLQQLKDLKTQWKERAEQRIGDLEEELKSRPDRRKFQEITEYVKKQKDSLKSIEDIDLFALSWILATDSLKAKHDPLLGFFYEEDAATSTLPIEERAVRANIHIEELRERLAGHFGCKVDKYGEYFSHIALLSIVSNPLLLAKVCAEMRIKEPAANLTMAFAHWLFANRLTTEDSEDAEKANEIIKDYEAIRNFFIPTNYTLRE